MDKTFEMDTMKIPICIYKLTEMPDFLRLPLHITSKGMLAEPGVELGYFKSDTLLTVKDACSQRRNIIESQNKMSLKQYSFRTVVCYTVKSC